MVSGLSGDGQGSFSREQESAQVQPDLLSEEEGDSWRRAVSGRLHRYHARRRPRAPAGGGVTIEEIARAEPERRPGIDMPLQSAAVRERVMAAAIDVGLVAAAAAVFGGIFYRVTGLTPTPLHAATVGAGLLSVLWAGYQYLLLVYSGTTPGLCALGLRVQRFDGGEA